MPYVSTEVVREAKKMDLLTYLRSYEPENLVRLSANSYCTRDHDSLKISNGKWMWWSQGIGGRSALDYLIKVRGMEFIRAVETITGKLAVQKPLPVSSASKDTAYSQRPLLLPQKCKTNERVMEYLFGRGIDYEIINYCLDNELIYESLPHHDVIFLGFDENRKPNYAAYRATTNVKFMGDCAGSKKQYSFRITDGMSDEVHLFECAIDLLSYATIQKYKGANWRKINMISLAGVYAPKDKIEESKLPITLKLYLEQHPKVKRIVLHLDNDFAGKRAATALKTILPQKYEIIDDRPKGAKDVNDLLLRQLNIQRQTQKKYHNSFER
jgi:hypothetical protein